MNHKDKLQQLLNIAEQNDVTIVYDHGLHQECHMHGLYFADKQSGKCIVLDDALKSKDELHVSVLAEELGHHFSDVQSNFCESEQRDILRDEVNALRWAVKFLATA